MSEQFTAEPEETKEPKQQPRKIVEDIGTHIRYEGDDFWHTIVIGGEPVPYIVVGPGPQPDPRPVGQEYIPDWVDLLGYEGLLEDPDFLSGIDDEVKLPPEDTAQ